jgi:hypothetical protein
MISTTDTPIISFISIPFEVKLTILSYLDSTSKIALVCKEWLIIEERIWNARFIREFGNERGVEFFTEFKRWNCAYKNFSLMSKLGSVISVIKFFLQKE